MSVDVFSEAQGLYLYVSVCVFCFGACMGSFLNVCIYRIPEEISVVSPRSRCPRCMTPIAWYHNIPLISWIALRGRCRQCRTRISFRYFVVELLTAILFLLIWMRYDAGGDARPLALISTTHVLHVPILWLFAFGLILATFVDFDHLIIPDRTSLGGIVIGIAATAVAPSLHLLPGEETITIITGLKRSLIGVAAGSGLLYGIGCLGKVMFRKDAMGLGDVKLLGAIGAFLGWQATIFTAMAASAFGAVVGVSLIVSGKREMGSRIPFGPYLALAAMIWILWGTRIWHDWIGALNGGY